jgi:hypothetical protein
VHPNPSAGAQRCDHVFAFRDEGRGTILRSCPHFLRLLPLTAPAAAVLFEGQEAT